MEYILRKFKIMIVGYSQLTEIKRCFCAEKRILGSEVMRSAAQYGIILDVLRYSKNIAFSSSAVGTVPYSQISKASANRILLPISP